MNFNTAFFKIIRKLLFPFSLVYLFFVSLRNWLYNINIFKSTSFKLPIINVGNIAAGGTGKTPMVEYLINHLSHTHTIATLSRGYKRKTKGYILANTTSTALALGDEPMQFHAKFKQIAVAVGEKRAEAIPKILHDKPNTQVIILDDAFQHRAVKAGLNLVLTDCNNLYPHDWYLPTGNLRDEKASAKRAAIIIVTKCNPQLTVAEKNAIIKEIQPQQQQKVFFTQVTYSSPYHFITKAYRPLDPHMQVLLVTGIANPAPIQQLLKEKVKNYFTISHSDHHAFSQSDILQIKEQFDKIDTTNKIILTTEKDAVRLIAYKQQLENTPLYVLPIELAFLFNDQNRFNELISTFISGFDKNELTGKQIDI